MAEYQRGTGPDALPQGSASALNAVTPTASQFGDAALENTDIPVEYAPGRGAPIPDDDTGANDDEAILTDWPDPGFQPRVLAEERPGRVPRYVVRHLAQFRTAATAPDAPPGLRALYRATIRQLEEEDARGD